MVGDPKTMASVRLGWAISELRGRCRPAPPPGSSPRPYARPPGALPLGSERSNSEAAIGVMATITSMAEIVAIDPKETASDGTTQISLLGTARTKTMAIATKYAQLHALQANDTTGTGVGLKNHLDEGRKELSECLYKIDERFQDGIAALGEPMFSGYQVGRGLADLYWAVDPIASDDAITSWSVIFGRQRVDLDNESLARLASELASPFIPSAIAASLKAWEQTVGVPANRQLVGASSALHEQVTRYYDVLIGGRDPQSYVKPLSLIRQWRTLGRLIRAFGLQLALLAIGIGLVAWMTVLITNNNSNVLAQVVLGITSGLGISTAAVQTRMKNASQALLKKLRVVANGDLIAIDFTVPLVLTPPQGEGGIPIRRAQWSARRLVVQSALQHTLSVPWDQ